MSALPSNQPIEKEKFSVHGAFRQGRIRSPFPWLLLILYTDNRLSFVLFLPLS